MGGVILDGIKVGLRAGVKTLMLLVFLLSAYDLGKWVSGWLV